MAFGIIYRATGPDGRMYIGQTTLSLKQRKAAHKCMALKRDKRSAFQLAILDHGFSCFIWDEIDQAETKEELDQKEKYWISHYNSMNPEKGYNNQGGGVKTVYSPEARKKISEALKGRRLSPEHRWKISEALKGRPVSEETRRKLSEAERGEKHYSAKIIEATARAIKADLQAGLRVCELVKKYNVSRFIIDTIKRGKTWAWL